MIKGKSDTWITVEEFASMIGRAPKTVVNWASEGRIQFAHLYGVPLISMAMIENLITGVVPPGAADGKLALRLAARTDSRAGRAQSGSALTRSPIRG